MADIFAKKDELIQNLKDQFNKKDLISIISSGFSLDGWKSLIEKIIEKGLDIVVVLVKKFKNKAFYNKKVIYPHITFNIFKIFVSGADMNTKTEKLVKLMQSVKDDKANTEGWSNDYVNNAGHPGIIALGEILGYLKNSISPEEHVDLSKLIENAEKILMNASGM